MQYLSNILDHPAAILFLTVVAGLFLLKFQNLGYQEFISTTNTINPQSFALVVLVVGFWMLIDCKTYGIDTTVAGGVIGCGINMLTGQKSSKPDIPAPDPNSPK